MRDHRQPAFIRRYQALQLIIEARRTAVINRPRYRGKAISAPTSYRGLIAKFTWLL
jgi:hypothetical protein